MKQIFAWFAFAVASSAMAALESVKFDSNNLLPGFPLSMVNEGVTEAHVIFAVSISPEGRVNDALPLAYTHEALVAPCRAAMSQWAIQPAKFGGEPVPVQVELRFDFKREGVVETSTFNIMNNFLYSVWSGLAERLAYRLPRAAELDRLPVPLTAVSPAYAQQAEKDGLRGKVHVHFYIDEKGEVRLPSVMADSPLYLADLAVTALRQWRFEPPTRAGRPVLVAASQEFDFGQTK